MIKMEGKGLTFSPGFLCLLAWLFYMDHQNILPWALLACFLHEMGHYWAIFSCGGGVGQISLTIVGAEMELPHDFSYLQELYCALSGPLVNILLAFWFCHSFPMFSGLNLALALVNLLPLSRLDGGRALSSLVGLCFPYSWKSPIEYGCDIFFTTLVVVMGVLVFWQGGSITLLILGLWLLHAIQ